MTADIYDNTGAAYNVTRVMNAAGEFDVAGYEAYSPAFLPAAFAFVYGLSFASLTAVPVHIYLWHWQQIKDGVMGRTRLDVHARLMMVYKKVPWWWFASITCGVTGMAIAAVVVYDTHLPVCFISFSDLIIANAACLL